MGTANSRTVSAALDQDLFNFIEDYRWKNRKKRSEVIVEAVENWAVKHGYDMESIVNGLESLSINNPTDGGD